MGKETILIETCIISVFEHLMYQNAKTPEYHSICRNITLSKTCIAVSFQKPKRQNAYKAPYKKKLITKNVYYECF